MLLGNITGRSAPQLGQPADAFIEHYGHPASQSSGTLTSEITFRNGMRITVHDGIVVGM